MRCFGSSMKSHVPSALRRSPSTVSTWIFSRVSVTFSFASLPGCTTVSVTAVPSSPLSRSTASSSVRPSVLLPSISTMRSPASKPGAIGGRAVHRAEDLKLSVVGGDLNADAAELALDAGAESAQFVRPDVARIGIELAQHAADGRLDQLAPIDLGDVVPLDLVDRVDQDLVQFVVVVGLLRSGLSRLRFLGLLGVRRQGQRSPIDQTEPQNANRDSSHERLLQCRVRPRRTAMNCTIDRWCVTDAPYSSAPKKDYPSHPQAETQTSRIPRMGCGMRQRNFSGPAPVLRN